MKKNIVIIFALLLFCSVFLTSCNNSNQPPYDNKSIEFTLGTYVFNMPPDTIEEGYGDEFIIFSDNNRFNAYLGWGASLYGNYSISENNIITCNAIVHTSEYTNTQNVDICIKFKIKDNSNIEVLENSGRLIVETSVLDENSNWVPSGETKEFSLYPYEAGMKFTLSTKIAIK